jgi:hypothetical protein
MQKETVTFDKLPEAVGYLTEQVIELKKMVAELQPQPSDKHVLVEIDDACHIIRKAKPPYIHWYAKGYFRLTRKARNSISMRTSFLLGLRTDEERLLSRHTRRCLPICKAVFATSPNHQYNFNGLGYG